MPIRVVRAFDHSKLEALIETLFLAAYADEEFSEEEQRHFRATVLALANRRVDEKKLRTLIARFQRELGDDGRAARLASIKRRLPGRLERRVALTLAVEMTAADGIIRTSERELILDLAEGLDIDRDEAADVVRKLEP